MRMTNDSYCITLRGKRTVERYYRDKTGWLKVSTRGRLFRMTPEQVLNHLLPALAFSGRLGLTVTVDHYEGAYWQTLQGGEARAAPPSSAPPARPARARPQAEYRSSAG